MGFLSTLSLRRATSPHSISSMILTHFYPRSPCGERHRNIANGERKKNISIHALLAESDAESADTGDKVKKFLSTLSLRRATGPMEKGQVYYIISIHALLAESDATAARMPTRVYYFYPRSPCGERRTQSQSLSA